jgi:phosphinothricin acetyltransferase
MEQQPVSNAGATIAAMREEDWPAVRAIYEEGIAGGEATFETETPSWETWDAAHLHEHRLVARRGDDIVGWAAVVPVSRRRVYAGVAEHSVYVATVARGQGVGRLLLDALIASTERGGIWMLQSGIFPENTISLRLHQACGFRVVGTRERIGHHQGRWRDVILIERRSAGEIVSTATRSRRP